MGLSSFAFGQCNVKHNSCSKHDYIYRAFVADVLARLPGCETPVAYESLLIPGTPANGDLVLPVPRLRIKGKKPAEQSAELAAAFPDNHPLFQKPVTAGIHLPFFTPLSLPRLVLPYIFQRQQSYGNDSDVGLRNYAAPDQGRKKEFHAGHLRSTIIGAFTANLYETMGWDVVEVNYLGDWGKQFGLLAVGWQRFGSEEELAREPLKHLLDVYARINTVFRPEQEESKKARDEGRDTAEIEFRGLFAERNAFFSRMEAGDQEAVALWRRFRDTSIDRYIATYARLNIDFDEYSGESQVNRATIEWVESVLREKGIYEQNKGSWVIDFEKHGFKSLGLAVVRGRTGTTTYLLRDVAAVLDRVEKYAFDKMIYVISTEQDLYFRRVFRTVELMGRPDLAARLQHVNFGKSREAMHEVMRRNEVKYSQVEDPDAVAEKVGISAVMVQNMSGKCINNYPFDIGRMTSFEGDTGPYLQYCHARLNSILRKADLTRQDLVDHLENHPDSLDADVLGGKPHAADLLRLMAQYPDVTAVALKTLEPSTILTYLFRLAHQLSSYYDVLQVVGAESGRDVVLARAALYEGARQVLERGMRLLGLNPVEG
ncbi:arginyl-tRNA synthetase [Parathielavia hyrcaniae]|uniref:arginine--tRNA ligase n=1 Tax=Parathielavia hyrcaniae TaxID=113614 RepID=A0AAN6PVG1_9PEZI|nr:arginyl-tRNA synthetase [Parathielavia hyrcaniae]